MMERSVKHAVVYVPGLGDNHYRVQAALIALWRLWGVRPRMVRMRWSDGELFDSKLQLLLDEIDTLHEQGYRVSLVGASAGAGAVINAYAARADKIIGVVLIAGWVNNPEDLGSEVKRINPAFASSAYAAPAFTAALTRKSRARILSLYALHDPVVSRKHSVVAGARNRTVPTIGHGFTIAAQLIFGAPFFIRFLKRRA